jgi:hypothetical protein
VKLFLQTLRFLTIANYWLRERRILPDKWFWADRMLLERGYAVGPDNKLVQFGYVAPVRLGYRK